MGCEYRVGWPVRCLAGSVSSTGKSLTIRQLLIIDTYTRLPYGVLPYGFAVNTLFYAALLWPPLLGMVALRRHLRTRRGLCPACAYPVGETSVCSECGEAVGTRRPSPT